jgi:signal transduction histidine kinase
LAAETPDLEEAREAVEDIISDGRRASAVLGRVRQLAKKSAPERAPVDVNGAISEVLSLTQQELQRNQVAARAELDPNLPPVLADRIQVQQVILNLVMNGIDAMRANGRLWVRSRDLRWTHGDGREAQITVTQRYSKSQGAPMWRGSRCLPERAPTTAYASARCSHGSCSSANMCFLG